MTWLRAFLIYSAVTTSVKGFSVSTQDLEANSYSQLRKENKGQYIQYVQQPSRELENDMFESSIEVIFISQSETLKTQNSTDQDRYMYKSIPINNDKKIETLNMKQPDSKVVNTNRSSFTDVTTEKKDLFMESGQKPNEQLLFPREISAITGSQPNYFYGVLPILPFPGEISKGKETIESKRVTLSISQDSMENNSQLPHVAGPLPYPQSTYAREFDLPFFD